MQMSGTLTHTKDRGKAGKLRMKMGGEGVGFLGIGWQSVCIIQMSLCNFRLNLNFALFLANFWN